jgi:transcriptional regulator with XRE-family HTH domain
LPSCGLERYERFEHEFAASQGHTLLATFSLHGRYPFALTAHAAGRVFKIWIAHWPLAFLKVLRESGRRAGLSQAQVAERSGETQTFVGKCERGKRRIDAIKLGSFCRAFGVSLRHFVMTLQRAKSRTNDHDPVCSVRLYLARSQRALARSRPCFRAFCERSSDDKL